MSTRMSVTLPDELHTDLLRIADSSHLSLAAAVRAILADVVPRITSVIDYMGTSPAVSPADASEADVWLQDLQRLYARAPESLHQLLGEEPMFDPPPASS